MQRYNIFLQVHKGLRAMLYQTAARLQQTDFTNNLETGDILDQVLEVVDLFDKHAGSEDIFILSAVERYEPGIAALFEKAHVEDQQLSSRIRVLLNIFYYTEKPDEKNVVGSAIRFAFVEFLAFSLKQMANEEDILNNLLWKYYSDEELKSITGDILVHIHPQQLDKYNRWMMAGLNNVEIINWLKVVRNNAPDFVFGGLMSLAVNELPEHRWDIVKEALSDGAMVA